MSSYSFPANPAFVPGMEGTLDATVRMEWTRAFYDPRFPAVFSTPAMIALMEGAIATTVNPVLAPGTFTVGTRIEVDHVKAVPVGAAVSASAKLAEIRGRVLIFDVEARSGGDVIGRGRIFHTLVDLARFQRIAPSGVPSGNTSGATSSATSADTSAPASK
jgi:fluoroacetyl-CoA thioesterase